MSLFSTKMTQVTPNYTISTCFDILFNSQHVDVKHLTFCCVYLIFSAGPWVSCAEGTFIFHFLLACQVSDTCQFRKRTNLSETSEKGSHQSFWMNPLHIWMQTHTHTHTTTCKMHALVSCILNKDLCIREGILNLGYMEILHGIHKYFVIISKLI